MLGFRNRVIAQVQYGRNPTRVILGTVTWEFPDGEPQLSENELKIALICHYYSRALADLGTAAGSLASVAERDAMHAARGESIDLISRLSPLARLTTQAGLAELDGIRETRAELKLPALMGRPAYQFSLKTRDGSFEPISSILVVRDALSRIGEDVGRLANAIRAIGEAYRMHPSGLTAEASARTAGLRAANVHRGPTDEEIRQRAEARISGIRGWFRRNS